MNTYFITGGLGFLGQYIVKAIHDHEPDAELRVLVRTQRKTHLEIESLDRIQWVHGDLLQPETYAESLRGVDTVIHNAAMVSFRKSEAEAVVRSNVTGTRELVEIVKEAGCRNFIFISSASAIGSNPGHLADESMYPDLEMKRRSDAYGYSKLISEAELRGLKDEMRIIILNPSVIFGPGSDRVDMAMRAAKLLPVIPMLQYVNSFVDVRDVAQAVVLALTKGRSGERYIITAWNESMVELTGTVLRLFGRKAWVIPLSRNGIRVMDVFLWFLDVLKLNPGIRRPSEMSVDKPCSNEKIKMEMGWKPTMTLDQSILDTING